MSEITTEAPAFETPQAVHYTDRNGNVRVALVLEPETATTPAKLRVLRSNGTTSVRLANMDAESGTYRKAADPTPEIPEVVAYSDRNGDVRPALVKVAETEETPATVQVIRNNGTTYTRNARKDPDSATGVYRKVASPSFGSYDSYDEDDESSDSDE